MIRGDEDGLHDVHAYEPSMEMHKFIEEDRRGRFIVPSADVSATEALLHIQVIFLRHGSNGLDSSSQAE